MKRLYKPILVILAAFLCAGTVLAYTNPGRPTGFVNDFADVFLANNKATLETKLFNFQKSTGAEVAVVTVPSLGGDTIENFAVNLFKDWGIVKKNADNGVLILVSPSDKQVRIEVGYGLEPTITDAVSSVIIRNIMIPAFKSGDYYSGVNQSVDKIIGLITNDPEAIKFVSESQSTPIFVPIIFIIIFIIMMSTRGGRRILFYLFLNNMFRNDRGGRNGWGGGGFGGFGGGRSGGGGASGSW